MKYLNCVIFLICLAVVLLLYANTVGHGFVLDDWPFLYYNDKLNEGFGAVSSYFKDFYSTDERAYRVYRPVLFAVFAAEQGLFGGNLMVKHGTNILLFGVCCFLLLGVIKNIFPLRGAVVGALAVMWFAVHPIHVEVVANLKSRDELLAFIGGMGALWGAVSYCKKGNWWYLPIIFTGFCFGLFSKASTVQFIPLIVLSIFFTTPKGTSFLSKKHFFVVFFLLLGLFCYKLAVWEVKTMDSEWEKPVRSILSNPLTKEMDIWQRSATAWAVAGEYLRLLVVPRPLVYCSGYNYFPLMGWLNWQVWVGLLLHLGLLVYALYDFLKQKSVLAYGILFYLIGILAVCNLFKVMPDLMANRFVFFASAGFCVAAASGVAAWAKWDTLADMFAFKNGRTLVAFSGCLLVAGVFAYLTIERNKVWKNNLALFEADMPQLENCAQAHLFYANELLLRKGGRQLEEMKADTGLARLVLGHAQKAVDIAPEECRTYTVLARAQRAFGLFNEALASSRQCEARGGEKGDAAELAAETYFQADSFALAVPLLKEAMAHNIKNKKTHELLAWSYFRTQQFDSAYQVLDTAMAKWPKSPFFVREKGKMYFLNKDTTAAFPYLTRAYEMWPTDPETLHMLALGYLHKGDTIKAKQIAAELNRRIPALKGR